MLLEKMKMKQEVRKVAKDAIHLQLKGGPGVSEAEGGQEKAMMIAVFGISSRCRKSLHHEVLK